VNETSHVLIVDDNQINRMMISRAVADLGHRFTTANDGQAALELLRAGEAEPFDAVLLDILMPQLDGYETLEQIKKDETLQHLPVIMISALDELDSVVRCIEIGATDYLTKPIKPALLSARLNASLQEKRLRDLEREYLEQAGRVAAAAEAVEAARFDPESLDAVAARPDALGQLARVFQRMAREVHLREQRLKNQLARLHLDMDEMTKAMSEPLHVYIPMDRRQAIANGRTLPEAATGAVLDADISGFTPLTAALAQDLGLKQGAEEITRYLNQVFGSLVAEVHRFGGSVVSFSGDAITCWFDGDDGKRAMAAGFGMQSAMEQYGAIASPSNATYALTLKVAIVAGPVKRILAGDPDIQVADVLAGKTLSNLAVADHLVESGEVLVSEAVARPAAGHATIQEWRTDPETGERYALLTDWKRKVKPSPWPELSPESISIDDCRPWLPPAVFERIRSNSRQFLADLRPAAALFVNFKGIDYDNDPQAAAKLNLFIRWVQTVLVRYEGNLIQLSIGDKGSYFFAAFGAPVAHNDDAIRAVYAGLAIQSLPPELDFISSLQIGIAMGQMRTGAYGSTDRRSYGVMGDKVNLAARLMQAATQGMLCDTAIHEASHRRLVFETLEPIAVKGKSEPLAVFRPTGERRRAERVRAGFIGRLEERVRLRQRLEGFQRGEGGVVMIEGEAGIGKSRLLEDVETQLSAMQIPHFHVSGNLAERSVPFIAWRDFFNEILSHPEDGADLRLERAGDLLAAKPELQSYLPLLGELLALAIPENESTEYLQNANRRNKTRDLLTGLLGARLQQPIVFLVENAQDLDEQSWQLLATAIQHNPGSLVIFASRPLPEYMPPAYAQILRHPSFEYLPLRGINPDEVYLLICEHLNIVGIPKPLLDRMTEASGNPLLIEEMIYTLKDNGYITTVNGVCQIDSQIDWGQISMPTSVQSVHISRIDQLSPSEQLVLKIASVLGKRFHREALAAIFPVEADMPMMDTHLHTLVSLDLIRQDTATSVYTFRNDLSQELAYNSLLYAQRRQLHRRAAEHFESTADMNLPDTLGTLAIHWRYADEPGKAIEYFEKAGRLAGDQGNLKKAEYYYQQSLEVMTSSAVLSPEFHRTGPE
jgi:CheY-like chemotaxis protein/tetratricopeptide (TPR) repeat protein